MSEFTLKILVPGQIRARPAGRRFLDLLIQHFPERLPERFGNVEPLRNRLDRHNFASALDCWGAQSFIAERRQPRVYFMVSFWPLVSKDPRHSSITFFRLEAEAERVSGFLIAVCEAFNADYAFAHRLTKTELEERLEQLRERAEENPHWRVELSERLRKRIESQGYASLMQDQLVANIERVTKVAGGGSEFANRQVDIIKRRISKQGFATVLSSMISTRNHTVHLRKHLQDLYWVNVFGRPYIEMFGRERLISAPAAQTREFTNGLSLRITEELADNGDSWTEFKAVRSRCKAHLNSNAFFDPSAAPGHNYRVPNFVFAPNAYREDGPPFAQSF